MELNAMWETRPDLHGRIKRRYEEDDYRWCQDSNARDTNGNACLWNSEYVAVEFSLLGAVYKAFRDTAHWHFVSAYLMEIFNSGFWEGPLIDWNDTPNRTYEDVINFLDKYKL
jgi:hypothetical protein